MIMLVPGVAKVVKKYLEMLKWEVLAHFSVDFAPSDFHPFHSMIHNLAEEVKN